MCTDKKMRSYFNLNWTKKKSFSQAAVDANMRLKLFSLWNRWSTTKVRGSYGIKLSRQTTSGASTSNSSATFCFLNDNCNRQHMCEKSCHQKQWCNNKPRCGDELEKANIFNFLSHVSRTMVTSDLVTGKWFFSL